ncbi:MAG: nucleotidyl transferase AbiEii/AbiGii toxin family protein, partial [Prevotellaceae bacterium]|nr:nucleotidyl transferase AbiEii/AbiGii toxin family protein [Prevotellaceae bacterium]
NVPLHFEHLQQRARQINSITETDFSIENFRNLLKERILKTDINAVKNDVRPFIKKPVEMEIWSTEYFLQLVDMIRFE